MTHLPVFEKDARLFASRAGELEHGRGAAHALQLNNVGDVQIAKRALEFLILLLRTRLQ